MTTRERKLQLRIARELYKLADPRARRRALIKYVVIGVLCFAGAVASRRWDSPLRMLVEMPLSIWLGMSMVMAISAARFRTTVKYIDLDAVRRDLDEGPDAGGVGEAEGFAGAIPVARPIAPESGSETLMADRFDGDESPGSRRTHPD